MATKTKQTSSQKLPENWNSLVYEAKERLTTAKLQLILKFPFFGYIALRVAFVASLSAGGKQTTAITPSGFFYYNPEWVLSMNSRDLMFEVAHEIMHIVQSCTARFPIGGNHATWNQAADYLADTMLIDAKLHQSEVSKKMVPKHIQKSVRDKTTEDVYYMLMKEEGTNNGGGGAPSMQPGTGDDGPAVPSAHHHKNNPRGCASAAQAIQQANQLDVEKMKQTVMEAANWAQNRGELPGCANDFIMQLKKANVTWRDILRRQAMSVFKGRYSFHKPARRSEAIGMYLPVKRPTPEAAIVMIDTSGSISDDELTQFMSECAGILRACGAPKMTIYFHDVECYHHEKYTTKTMNRIRVTRGGTSHIDVFAKVMKNESKVGMVIAFTDLYTMYPPTAPPFPVIWAHTPNATSQDVPFGTKVNVRLNE